MKASGISSRFQLLSQSPGQIPHVLRTRSPLNLPEQAPWTSFDLHVLSVPPAFILSQDQTLQQKCARPNPTPKCAIEPKRLSEERNLSSNNDRSSSEQAGKGPQVHCVLAVWPTASKPSPKQQKQDDRPVSVFDATRDGDTEIDWAETSTTQKVTSALPALAFCLLFCFQGAKKAGHSL
jgi:hypothetical protein